MPDPRPSAHFALALMGIGGLCALLLALMILKAVLG